MDSRDIEHILRSVQAAELTVDEAMDALRSLPYQEVGSYARLDTHRHLRTALPEVVFCQGKTSEQVAEIMMQLVRSSGRAYATRASVDQYAAVVERLPEAVFHRDARVISVGSPIEGDQKAGYIAVLTGGTADLPVAEEAAITLEWLGSSVTRLYDVGVAGVHRLLDHIDVLQRARAMVVVAGMEGALASVAGGLVSCPVVAVPTSTGYGASFGGLAALLTMLNSCAPGVAVVNIDNGFGAACHVHRVTHSHLQPVT